MKEEEFFDTFEYEARISEAERMKKKMSYTCIRQTIGDFANSVLFQLIITIFIIINAICMGLATYSFVYENPRTSEIFETMDLFFLIIFTVEIAFQLIYHGIYLFRDGWLVFDFVIILASWLFHDVQIFRAFRIFRVFRLLKRVKPIRDAVEAIFCVLPRMFYIGFFVTIIFCISAVLFTTLYKDLPTEEEYFISIDWSMFTLLQTMCLDDWSGIAREVMSYEKMAWLPFVAYVITAAFVLVNLFVAVLCKAISKVRYQTPVVNNNDSLEDIKDKISELTRIIAQCSRTQERFTHMTEYYMRRRKMEEKTHE